METGEAASREELLERVEGLERLLKDKKGQARACEEKSKTSSLFEFSEKGFRLKLYRLLLKKYSETINEKEEKTIGEVKAMVNADDLTIQGVVAGFKGEGYDFEKGYPDAAKQAFEFVKKEIHYVKADIDIDYFLSPVEIMTEKVADDEDQAVFLCSLLLALGDEGASVLIAELENLSTHAFVVIEYDEKAHFLDPTQDHSFDEFSGQTEEVLKKYSFNNKKIKRLLYKFNRYEYKSFIEEE